MCAEGRASLSTVDRFNVVISPAMAGSSILVTGGAGFIASHLVDAFIGDGWDVTVVDDLSTGAVANLNPAARFVEGDIGDAEVLDELGKLRFDVINHHAAQIDVRKSVQDPGWDAQINLVAPLRMMERARGWGVKKVIFASSGGAIYGEPEFAPQSEDHPMGPISPYGCAKLAFEQYLHFYDAIYGIPSVSLRYANVYGPRQRKDGEAGVIAIFASKILSGETLVINGDGEQTRDFVFVGDVVRANVAAVSSGMTGAFNVGTGAETTVNELFEMIVSGLGVEVTAERGPAKQGEQRRSVLDATRLMNAAGIESMTDLRSGLKETIDWLQAGS